MNVGHGIDEPNCVDDVFADSGVKNNGRRGVGAQDVELLRRRPLKPRKLFRDKAENWPPMSWSGPYGSLRCRQIQIPAEIHVIQTVIIIRYAK